MADISFFWWNIGFKHNPRAHRLATQIISAIFYNIYAIANELNNKQANTRLVFSEHIESFYVVVLSSKCVLIRDFKVKEYALKELVVVFI